MDAASAAAPGRTILYDLLCAPSSPIGAVELDELVRVIGRARVDSNEALRRELTDLSSIYDGLQADGGQEGATNAQGEAAFERVMLCTQLAFFIGKLLEYAWVDGHPHAHGGAAAGRARALEHVQSLVAAQSSSVDRGRSSTSTAAASSRPSTAASGSSSDSTLAAVATAAEATVHGRLFDGRVDEDTVSRVAAHMREALDDECTALQAEIEWMQARIDAVVEAGPALHRRSDAGLDAAVEHTCKAVGVDVHSAVATLKELKASVQREWLRTEAALMHGRGSSKTGGDADGGVFRTRLHATLQAAAQASV